jgi:NhaP-type Na+/H+ and K+/H+ antiporter
MTEITDFGAIVLIVTAGFALAALSTTLTGRVPVPAPAIFLLAAAVVSDIWPRVYEAVPIVTVERIAVVALIVILFNGGVDFGWRRFRASAAPILSLGLLGTFATAGLAAFALLGGVAGAERVYGVVFVVVLISVVGQGTLVPSVARALAIPIRERPALPWELSVRLGEEPPAAHEFEVGAGSRAAGQTIRDLPLGENAWITLVVRDGAATRPGGSLELRPGLLTRGSHG